MNQDGERHGLDLRTASGQEVNAAMARGVHAALKIHKEAGRTIVVWEDGRVVHVPPEEIEVPGAGRSGNAHPGTLDDPA